MVKGISSYISQYPVQRTSQNALHFTSMADLFNRTSSRLLCKHPAMPQLMHKDYSYINIHYCL